MKITNAWIDDPTLEGHLESPKLCVEVDVQPDMTIPTEAFAGGWEVSKYGPFVKYNCRTESAAAGEFNVRFRHRLPVVVDIDLYVGEHSHAPKSGFSLPLSRARQLVRKYEDNWRLLVSDHAAEAGTFLWVPVETDPACREWTGRAICKTRPAHSVRIKNVNMPLCKVHIQAHNAVQATQRAERNAS